MPSQIALEIVTQERPVLQDRVEAIIAPASEGEVTILPGHTTLFTKLKPGELRLFKNNRWQVLAVAGGFMDVAPQDKVTILANSAVRVEEINIAKAEAAKHRAEAELKRNLSAKEFTLASSDLRRAAIELQTARKYRRRQSLPGQ